MKNNFNFLLIAFIGMLSISVFIGAAVNAYIGNGDGYIIVSINVLALVMIWCTLKIIDIFKEKK